MELTDERVIPRLMKPSNQLLQEHISRYKFAAGFAKGRVLDIACGVGYGLKIIQEEATLPINQLIGVDMDSASISYAIENYWQEGMDFFEGDALDISLVEKIGTFDTIISMETIEHLKEDELFVQNLAKLIKPGGITIISTPFGQGRGIPCSNPYHVHQYMEEEFVQILKPLGKLTMYYQIDSTIEKKRFGKKYYLMVAICEK